GRGDFGRRVNVVMRKAQLFTLSSADLISLTNLEVLTAVAEGLGQPVNSLYVARIENHPRLELELASTTTSMHVRVGDVIRGGLHITHNRFGGQATRIESYLLRLVCLNGMTRRECGSRRGPRTRKLSFDHPNAKTLQLEQIRRLAAHEWISLQPK